MMFRSIMAAAAALSLSLSTHAADWPNWRGPAFDGSNPDANPPTVFGPEAGRLWRAELPGVGASTPIMQGGRVFLTAQDGDHRTWALALNAETGATAWKHAVGKGLHNRHGNTAASPSPATDGKVVVFLFGSGDLLACTPDGRMLWSKDVQAEHGAFEILWDWAGSPLLLDGRVYLAVLHGSRKTAAPSASYLLCLDARTGRTLWKVDRRTDAGYEAKQAYTTPVPVVTDAGTHIVVSGGDHVTAHAADDGAEVWRSPSYNPRSEKWYRTVLTPVRAGDRLVAGAPQGGALFALPLDARGRLETMLWTQPRAPDICSPAVYEGRVYLVDGKARRLSCVDPATGRTLGHARIPTKGILRGSPTVAGGHVYCLAMDGDVAVFTATPQPELVHHVALGGSSGGSSIAIADDRLYIRTDSVLHCFGTTTTGTQP